MSKFTPHWMRRTRRWTLEKACETHKCLTQRKRNHQSTQREREADTLSATKMAKRRKRRKLMSDFYKATDNTNVFSLVIQCLGFLRFLCHISTPHEERTRKKVLINLFVCVHCDLIHWSTHTGSFHSFLFAGKSIRHPRRRPKNTSFLTHFPHPISAAASVDRGRTLPAISWIIFRSRLLLRPMLLSP